MSGLAANGGFTRADLDAMPDDGRRYELIDGIIVATTPGGLTRADRDAMPDDGRRYELIDGALVVSPSPVRRHQVVAFELAISLREGCPADCQVLMAPFDVALADDVVIEPDILVARRKDLTEANLPTAPVLAVEVLSPSTRWVDLGRKKELLAGAGCPSYWVVDPGAGSTGVTLIVHELDGGRYAEVARVSGAESWTAERPFRVTVVPADLLDE